MVIGLLGILKAGGAYVPLDPAYPKARLEFLLRDSRCSLLLTQQKWLGDTLAFTDSHSQLKIIALDRDADAIRKEDRETPRGNPDWNKLAYVIYTSGSTGTPKGVAIEHCNTVALLNWAKEVFTAGELAGVLASTSICFDLSVFELFVPLSWGGRVVLVENAFQLSKKTNAKRITLVNTVPSVMTALLKTGQLPDSVRVVNLAGEPLRPQLVEELYKTAAVEKVYDLYGPSETTTYSTFTLRTTDSPATIGRPISNTQIYILDSNSQPVPIGVPGEIHIGGSGVARGYLGRTELTKKKFIKNPFSDDLNSRLYRTGDLARYLPDGQIEFHGRGDNQVKMHGYRIELGEIESVLNQHPGVKESVVVVREDTKEIVLELPESNLDGKSRQVESSNYEKRLVAYIVARQQLAPTTSELHSFLAQQLPAYMIPAAFVRLDDVPLNSNGKLDRSKLPSPNESNRYLNELVIAPRTEIEELIANVWRDVLKLDNINVHDNFFEVGGHSLLAVQIVARLSEALNREVLLKTLFDAPTISRLAKALENILAGSAGERLPPIVPVPRDQPLPLSLNQEHLWHLDRMIPGTHFFNMPYVYRLAGALNLVAMENAVREMVRRHEALRTVFGDVDDNPVQIVRTPSDFCLSVVDLRCKESVDRAENAAALIVEERTMGFNLSEGPLLRVKIICLTDFDYLLLVTMHHIVGDEWSMQIFRSELLILYDAFEAGRISPLPEPILQFADYAIWERKLLDCNLLEPQIEYWRRRLTRPRVMPLFEEGILDKIRLEIRPHESIELDGSMFAEFKRFVVHENSTPFTVVIAALAILLHSLTGQIDIRMGMLIANRRNVETHGIIGHFLNTVLVHFHVRKGMTYRELLCEARENILQAYNNQEVPFEAVARALQRRHRVERDKLMQMLVAYSIAPLPAEVRGLKFAPLSRVELQINEHVALTNIDAVIRFTESSTKLRATVNGKESSLHRELATALDQRFRATIAAIVHKTNERIPVGC
jgi:amino acid adenylation domain-containing protein